MSAGSAYETSKDGVIRQLSELFGSVLHLDVIKSVAVSCRYDILQTSNKLLEMCHSSENRVSMEEQDKCSWKIDKKMSPSPLKNAASSYSVSSPRKSKKRLDFETAIGHINSGYKVLILMRGLPGSGKSSLAMKIIEHTIGLDPNYHMHVLSSDDYFCQNPQKMYMYDVRKLEEAHGWNQNKAFQTMSRGFSPVIIDNTNSQMWEMKAYATMAIDYGYILHILEPDTHWCFDDKELAKRNKHGVPRTKIKEMIDRYDKKITPQKLFSAYNLVYTFQKPPQLRLYPPPDVNVNSNNGTRNKPVNVVKSASVLGLVNNTNECIRPVETINLMEFDDDDSLYIKKPAIAIDKNQNNTVNSNIVDKIFTFNDNDETKNILKPTVKSDQDIFVINSDDENETAQEKDLYSRLHGWGLSENSLKSWDIVTPINFSYETNANLTQIPKNTKETTKETTDSTCNTEDEYFRLLNNDKLSAGFYGGLQVLETVNRDINHDTPKREPIVPLKLTLDKGCMTDDIYEDYEAHITELESLFPTVPRTHLSYWYNKFKGDLEWTIEFLLEGTDDIVSLIVSEDSENEQCQPPKTRKVTSDNEGIEKSDNTPITKSSKKKLKKSGSPSSPDNKEEIKKMLESKISIGGEHYSKELLRIKNYKLKKCAKLDSNGVNIDEPSTSKGEQQGNKVDEVVCIDSDLESDEPETETSEEAAEGSVELNLGDSLVSQLEQKFADQNIQYPKGFQPVVQMPINLAKQLYSFYVESVYQQMEIQGNLLDSLVKEDAEYARRMQAQEYKKLKEKQPESFKDIQEAQLAAKKAHQTEVDKWKNMDLDTLAATLTKQKLFGLFKSIPQDTLVEILHAHDNNYMETIESLLNSTQPDNIPSSIVNMKVPPIEDDVLKEMKEAQRKFSHEEEEERAEASHYREEAARYLAKRTELYEKARRYHSKGMLEVAQYYSGLASLQTSYYDRANNRAAAAFLDEHSKRLEDFNTLDLHFLYVKEAIPALDMFLDRNINLLRLSNKKRKESLQIITGRGKRSENGVSKIKPVVIAHLDKRKIEYTFLNPGLLQVTIHKKTALTNESIP